MSLWFNDILNFVTMNYLAHACLSFGIKDILAGNMISDFVKGRAKFTYPIGIQRGIELHRLIDEFTDNHPVTAEAKKFFKPAYRLYSGAFVDIVYDHFLANSEKEFSEYGGLLPFTTFVYHSLGHNKKYFPEVFGLMYSYMKSDNWLYNYKMVTGIQKSFGGLVRRALYMDDATEAYNVFTENYTSLRLCYNQFYPDVKQFAGDTLRNMMAR